MQSSKRQARLDRRRSQERQSQLKWLAYIVVAAVVVTVLFILAQQIGGPRSVSYTQKDGVTIGDPDAPVTIVEFADFQCAFCQNSYNTTEQPILEQYVDSGKAKYIYQLVGFLGPESVLAAEAGYCAADQNYFWEFHDVVFASVNFSHGNTGGYSEDRLINFARKVNGLNIDSFTQCMASDVNLARVDEAGSQASALGITGTPGFLINGAVFSGAQPFSVLQQAIEDALAAAGAD
jgi:protein-disulfide isomerase